MTIADEFATIFGVWRVARPYISMMVDEQEMQWSRDYVEIKRVYVRPTYRGQGIAGWIMLELESQALAEGYTCLRLETGIRQEAAIELYERLGYRKISPFGPYEDDPLSVFMEKHCRTNS